ncbi:MAG: DUF4215 domain-containing protein [Sorangiineae bacterium]|nr:DUF4215 domain-containing protein [Polyangiaceae bacterium]MEB2321796.1 DUF4215 domain-containing protein [Sorangiineae bacterium]
MLPRFTRLFASLSVLFVVAGCGSNAEVVSQAPGLDGSPPPVGGDGGFDAGRIDASPNEDADTPDADAETPAVCGDGVLAPTEACDDGNPIPGDGCSGTCTIEPGYSCPEPGQPCIFAVQMTCGNGKIEGTEGCDDDNTDDGDGCSAGCEVEQGYACATPGQPCEPVVAPRCGDGKVNSGEQCDDGNDLASDGCDASCRLEAGYTCPEPGKACEPFRYCGDGMIDASEECDDANSLPGDGCSALCKLEAGYECPTPGATCVNLWVCGNGQVDPGEACDDHNTSASDGCSADCTFVEPGWTCPNSAGAGGACTLVPAETCGNGIRSAAEQCDDGNTNDGDGCSKACVVEAGWDCPTPGATCKLIEYCGDKLVTLAIGEDCDDGNTTSGDGCSASCTREPNWACPDPGQPCVSTVVCGDKKITGSETCDDGNQLSRDGCSSTCQLEAGWKCPLAGTRCVATRCGDGILAGEEQCDDGNTAGDDGCSTTCQLQPRVTTTNPTTTQPGGTTTTHFKCPTPGVTCVPTVCGDGTREGSEQCDYGDNKAYDGCSPSCLLEPSCPNGKCVAVCGDGILFDFDANGDGTNDEECDDGNTVSGDGCSSACKVELGYSCIAQADGAPAFLDLPATLRDFKYYNTTNGHPDFEQYSGSGQTGLVKDNLSAGTWGIPVFNKSGTGPQITSADSFSDWYSDTTGKNRSRRIDGLSVRLTRQANGSYVFNSATDQPYKTKGARYPVTANKGLFLPIDGMGWGNQPAGSPQDNNSNFGFTTEIRYWFTYDSGVQPTLTFQGDDDVWVFVNGRLMVDLGGLHAQLTGSVTLTPAVAASLGLVNRQLYEVALFHAERRSYGSNFWLTLRGFDKKHSVCTEVCGDGVRTAGEQCDDGAANTNSGAYGSCTTSCQLGPYCGDATVQAAGGEQCDDGVNATTYGGTSKKCGPGCRFAPYCGDTVISNGESCDEGAANGSGYGHCSGSCGLGPRCGDGVVQAAASEQCDDGVANGTSGSGCKSDCTNKCGDGNVDPGEQCDLGAASNTGGYGGCTPECRRGPRCGDGIKNGGEQCDDGKNDGSYGTCKADCSFAGYCGDGTPQSPPETCDEGASNSSSAYGASLCTTACKPAPYCGDHAVDGVHGETCDDGVNSGQPGSCSVDCKGFIPLPSCGNGALDSGEQCDDGANNGKSGSTCDAHCKLKCGNGMKDSGEACDDGKNTGAYGTCNPDCTLPGYCGDGVKNGPELCDNGANNAAPQSAYGPNVCTTVCRFAAYCGDGRVDAAFGEECDGGWNCSVACKATGPR